MGFRKSNLAKLWPIRVIPSIRSGGIFPFDAGTGGAAQGRAGEGGGIAGRADRLDQGHRGIHGSHSGTNKAKGMNWRKLWTVIYRWHSSPLQAQMQDAVTDNRVASDKLQAVLDQNNLDDIRKALQK